MIKTIISTILFISVFIVSSAFASSKPLIRLASSKDLSSLVHLAMLRHEQYSHYQSIFWRMAPDAKEQQTKYFKSLLAHHHAVFFIATLNNKAIGMIMAHPFKEPPVYNPERKTYIVDDFFVTKEKYWPTVGRELLNTLHSYLKKSGVSQIIVIVGDADKGKVNMLHSTNKYKAMSTWYVGEFDEG